MTGVLLDSTYLVAAQRRRRTLQAAFAELQLQAPGAELVISVISAMELSHGIERSSSPLHLMRSQRFPDEALVTIFVQPVTLGVALRAGRLDGLLAMQGNRIATADLLIAATALELDLTVVTDNVRHFERVPGLRWLKV